MNRLTETHIFSLGLNYSFNKTLSINLARQSNHLRHDCAVKISVLQSENVLAVHIAVASNMSQHMGFWYLSH